MKKNSTENKVDYSKFFTKQSSVFIATFSQYENGKRMPRNGMVKQLLSFFLPKVNKIVLLDQPHVISDTINPIIELYNGKKLIKRSVLSIFLYLPIYLLCKIPSKKRTRASYKLRDLFSVLYVGIRMSLRYELFIGLESVNALGGLILKRLGIVKKVIYYVSDYSPNRFGNTWFNRLYLWLDRFCVRHADFTWDVSQAMKDGRIKAGMEKRDMSRVIHVPNALFPSQIVSLPIAKRKKNALVYMGTLDKEFGVEFAIKALPIIKKKIPDISLHVIGGGKHIEYLKKEINKYHLESSVTLYGFVMDDEEMAKIVRGCYVGIAPLRSFVDSYLWYSDTGKIRLYLACGLPVITTHVPPLGRLVAKEGAAIMVKDTINDFSNGVIRLLSDKNLYNKYTKKAEQLSKDNTWENSYTNAFREMSRITNN